MQSSKKIKVLRILNRFNLGGPIYNVAMLTEHLPKEFETKLVGGKAMATEMDATFILTQQNIEFELIESMGRKISLLDDIRTFFRLRKIIKEYRPQIVHTHASKAGFLGRLAAISTGTPLLIHTFHGNVFHGYFNRFKTFLVKQVELRLAKRTHALIAIAPSQATELQFLNPQGHKNKIHIIPLGFDLSKFSDTAPIREDLRLKMNIATDEIAVGIVGRLVPIKNHQMFIEAASECLKNEGLRFKFYIVGDGEERVNLERLIAKDYPTLKDRITFTSWIKEMEQFYPAMDLICLTSLNEGTPVSLIEAQAAGIPVISTSVGGVKDVISHLETGYILSSHSAQELASVIVELSMNSPLRLKMSKNARNFVLDLFSYQRLVREMSQLYKQLLNDEKP